LAPLARVWFDSMERSFTFEAKTFCLSAKDGYPLLRLEERRKGFSGYIFVSNQCASWLLETVEVAVLSQAKEEIAKSFREGDKVTMVHGGGNKAGIFLEVSVYAEGGRKGVIWLPEGRFGRGWRRFAGELRQLVAGQIKKTEKAGSLPGVSLERSFVDVLRSTQGVKTKASGLQVSSASPLDLFPAHSGFEMGSGGETRSAVDCAALESSPGVQAAAAAGHEDSTKMKGIFGITELLRYLGLINAKLDRVIAELGSRPSVCVSKPVSEDVSTILVDPGLKSVMCMDKDQGMDPVMDLMAVDSGLGSDLAMQLGRAMDSDPNVAFSMKSSIRVPELVCAGTRGSVGKVETSTLSPGVDPASQAVLGSGCPPGIMVEASASATLAVTSAPEIVFPAACREAGTSKSDACDDSKLALVGLALAEGHPVGLALAEVHPEVTQQGCASETRCPIPVSSMPRIGDLTVSSVDKVEAPVSPVNVSSVEGPAVVSAIPVGASAVPAKEGESVKIVSAKGLLRRGFLGAKNDSSSSLSEMKEVFSPEKGSKAVNEVSQVCASSKKHEGYARRVKEKFAKQVHKNRELFTEVVADTSEKGEENYSEVALDALKFASNMGWTSGEGDEKNLLNLFSKIEEERKPTIKVKGKRELKNLECSINYEDKERPSPERCHRQRGCVGTSNASSNPPEVH
jgi:hypothetical protein